MLNELEKFFKHKKPPILISLLGVTSLFTIKLHASQNGISSSIAPRDAALAEGDEPDALESAGLDRL